ncbi:nitronate monooxygenase [Candidatus Coxiella mudrowiae]|uniref:nitronate monooxygenase n=1 Tax=Candidatus Coxiella mudrowiae TaxID=2054173 RepID=UPI0006629279
MNTLFTIEFHLIQAPMAGRVITPELIAAVCNVGGLESLGAEYISPSEMKEFIDKIGQLTDKLFQSIYLF